MNRFEILKSELDTLSPNSRYVHELANLKYIVQLAIELIKKGTISKDKTDLIYSDIVTRLQKMKSGKPSYNSNRSNRMMEVLLTFN